MKDIEKEEKAIAKKLWDTPFASCNLQVLKKSQLLILIEKILNRIAFEYCQKWCEMDIKDVLFDQKCWLIEAVRPEFFGK